MAPATAAPIRVLVVDDEALARQRLVAMLASHAELTVIGEAASGSAAVEAIAGKRPDLLFLDVQMPGLDGFGVLRCVARAHLPAVVFVTAHDEHALRAFEIHAVDYLLKPVSAPRLREAVRRALERIRTTPRDETVRSLETLLAAAADPAAVADAVAVETRIPIRTEGAVDFIDPARVDWIEAAGDQVRIHVGGAVQVTRATMAAIGERLPAGFVRIHRSVIVNRDRIRRVDSIPGGGYRLTLADGAAIRSGRRYREAVQALIQPA